MFALTVNGKELSNYKTLSLAMAAARASESFPVQIVMHGAVLAEMKAPLAAPAPAPRKKRAKLVLVERTDADAAYDHVGEVAAAKVWVDDKTTYDSAAKVRAKGGAVCCALTLIYGEKPMSEPLNAKAPKAAKPTVAEKPSKKAFKQPEPKLTPEQKQTREEWLLKFTRDHCTDLFAKAGKEIPAKIRMACGWPSSRGLASGKRPRVVGQCWYPEASSDQHHEIFISPVLSDVTDVASTLIHELVHVVCGKEAGHGPRFKDAATGVGLEGKMTATVPTSWLKEWIAKAAQEVGVYPHATLDMSQQKKQGTRLLKVVCPDMECDYLAEEEKPYTVRMSASVFDAGKPCCGVCGTRMEVSE